MAARPLSRPAILNHTTTDGSNRILGTGEMADLIRAFDWSSTPLGAISGWSRELLTIVNLMLSCPSPARTLWGPDLILLYNDAYRPIPGPRHPGALGKASRDVYPEAWHVVGPLLEEAYATGKTCYFEKLPVPLQTSAGVQDFYLSYSYNPIFENGRIAGLFGVLQDVTGEVMASRRLRESEARVLRILNSIGDAVIVTDADGCVTTINPVAEALTGWSKEEAVGRPLSEIFRIVNEETRAPVESPAEKVKRLGAVVGLANHTVLLARDGTEVHIDDSGAPIRDDAGELTGIVLVFRDIHERRAAERERDQLTDRLNQVLETTTDGIISVDRDWRISYMNASAKAAIEPIGNVEGKDFWESFPDAVYEGSPYVEHYRRAMQERIPAQFEAHYQGPLNQWFEINVRPSQDGIVIFFRDVTEKKRAAALLEETALALKESEEELRWTVQLSPQVPWTADIEGRIVDFSDKWLDLTGLTREQALGDGWMQVPHPDDLPRMAEAWRASLIEGRPYCVEHRIRTGNGEYRWMRSSAYPRHTHGGAILKWYGTTEDIDERKRAEQALMQGEKLAAVGRLASSIAHEINNPLESVTNLLYLAQGTEDREKTREYVGMAELELRRVSAITRQALRFHKQSTWPHPVACDELIDSVLLIYQSRLANASIRVETRKRAQKEIKCFEGEIRQVLANLIGNAVDAIPVRGGRLLVRSREGRHWRSGRPGIVLTVADTGCGMDTPTQRRVFEAFFTTKDIGGTGLGLWISKEIVDRHCGMLRVRSSQKPDRCGTVFTLFLPYDAVSR